MKVYHGSTIEIARPAILEPVRMLDFGAGFYVTSSIEQAKRWAHLQQRRRNATDAIVSVYEFDMNTARDSLNIFKFVAPDGEWLDFVVAHRSGHAGGETYDLVIGPVANDDTMTVINDYMDGRYTKDEAVKRLLPQRLVNQYAFLTSSALSYLYFEGSVPQ